MSNLRAILDRLVQENLHGPIDPATQQDTVKNHAIRQAQQTQGHARGAHADPYRDFRESQRHDIDLDAHDPRWRQLFHELFVSDQSDDRNDDLLFFVQRVSDEVENGGLGVDPVFVKRKVKGTIGREILTSEQEDVVLWKDTFFLNVIVQLQCKLTVAVCSRVSETNPVTGTTKTSMICTRKHVSKRVYASPTKSRMDVKEESVECSWPLIYYVIDDYEDSFEQLMVRDNEYLCVELAVTVPTARTGYPTPNTTTHHQPSALQPSLGSAPLTLNTSHHGRTRATTQDSNAPQSPTGDSLQPGRPFPSTSARGGSKITLFQGAAGFQSLLGIYQQKAASKVGRRFKLGPHTVPTEFVMMRGPGARGHAQVAITASNIGDDLATLDDTAAGSPTSLRSHSEKKLPPLPNGQQDNHNLNGNGNGQRTSFAEGYGNVNGQQQQHQPPSRVETSPSLHSQTGPISSTSPSPGGSVSSTAKSFSAGSFFQSLRRISLATLAQATGQTPQQLQQRSSYNGHNSNSGNTNGGYENGSGSGSGTPTSSAVHSLTQNLNQSTQSFGSSASPPHSPSSSQQQRGLEKQNDLLSSNGKGSSISSRQDMINNSGVGTRQEVEALVKSPQSLRCCMTFVNVPWTGIATMLMDHAYHPSFSNPHPLPPSAPSSGHRHK
ncbi:hypothetical protein BG015_005886 [Linnemannia schmuckeri]|uniref:Uncharacterized protein n=1 Tax=Linnemannia schmuckeri TaxID=64567 RepID=A0A9P5S0R8_9FUNG|nr:hypothetical protein BG015_005886 [Linnemannia schmuckeri]